MTRMPGEPGEDAWPHTNRLLPWLLAGILVMIYLVPFDSITLPVHLPVNSQLDRFVLGGVFLVWLAVALAGPRRPKLRASPMNVAILLFLATVVASFAFNLRPLAWDGELSLGLKNAFLLVTFIVLFYICASTIEPEEVRPYAKFIVILACITAVGTIYEYDSGSNPFLSIAGDLFGHGNVSDALAVAFAGTAGSSVSSRPLITGPTSHGLADATIMSAAIPFALAFAASADRRRDAALWLAAIGLLLGGNIATGEKTGLLVPVVSFLVLLVYEPKKYARFLPLTLVVFLALEIAAPSAVARLWYQLLHASSSASTQTRVSDYGAVQPFLLTHLLIGRGYGSFDPFKYRILDNEMLDLLVGLGVIGTLSWIGVTAAAMVTAHRAASGTPENRRLMQGIVAFVAGFLVSCFTYDTLSFREAPYIFFFVSALAAAQADQPPPRLRSADGSRVPRQELDNEPEPASELAAR